MLYFFKPQEINSSKIRLGSKSDGGYVMSSIVLDNCSSLLTYGVGGDTSYESDFDSKYNKPVYMFDHTIGHNNWDRGNLHFRNEGLGNDPNNKEKAKSLFDNILSSKEKLLSSFNNLNDSRDSVNELKQVLETNQSLVKQLSDSLSLKSPKEHYNQYNLQGDILLKIDTEGAEFDYFLNEDIDDLSSFVAGIILEVHWIDQEPIRNKFISMMEKINKHFVVTHVHGNNWGGEFEYEGHKVPRVPEFSFVNKKYLSTYTPDNQDYPIQGLDYPNNPNLSECDLSFLKQL
jgi:hypothetical protein